MGSKSTDLNPIAQPRLSLPEGYSTVPFMCLTPSTGVPSIMRSVIALTNKGVGFGVVGPLLISSLSRIARMDRFFKNKNKRKKAPEPLKPEIPTKIADRPNSTVALDEGSSRGSRITFHDKRNEHQGLTAPKTLTPGTVVDGTQHGCDRLGEYF